MYPNPENYNLYFDLDWKTFKYFCKEKIKVNVNEPTKSIILDCEDLKILDCKYKKTTLNFVQDKKNKILEIQFDFLLKENTEYVINIDFEGIVNDGLAGWYKSKYIVNKETKYIATSQFEAAEARRAFLCVDNPNYKATYDISFEINKNLTGISNTQIIKDIDLKNSRKLIQFSTTPKMSSYLVYLGIGEFESITAKYKDIEIKGVAVEGKSKYTQFAIDCTIKFLSYFEEYFGYKFPLPKLDLISIPDFAAGAMENWGAITFRETAILYYPKTSSISKKNYIAEVVAHELAHQWFGNLVTMKWWNDLWLNESFATFMAYKAMDNFWLEWDVWTQYLKNTVFEGMKLDSMRSSHPINVTVNSADEIDELFDEIAYSKGGSLLRMLEAYLGDEIFRQGLRKYIKTYAYSNTIGANLWDILQIVSKKDISSIMQNFINIMGFPQIDVSIKEGNLYIQQSKFSSEKATTPRSWEIPINIRNGKQKIEINQKENTKVLPINISEYIITNANYSGFFVTNYDSFLLEKIGINWKQLNIREQLGLLHDLFILTSFNKIDIKILINFITTFLKKEQDPTILTEILDCLYKIFLLTKNTHYLDIAEPFADMSLQLSALEPSKGETTYISDMRKKALEVLIALKREDIKTFIQKKFDNFLLDEMSLHPNLKEIVYLLAVRIDTNNFNKLLDKYFKSNNQEEEINILKSLGSVQDIKMIKNTLEMLLSDKVRFNYITYGILGFSENFMSYDIVFKWIHDNWERIKASSNGMSQQILRNILQVSLPFICLNNMNEAKIFLQQKRELGLNKTFDQVLEELEINHNFSNKLTRQ